MRSVDQNAAMGKPGPTRRSQTPVGAAEGCDLLILLFSDPEKIKIKKSPPSAAPTGGAR
jgi:hypothetical protein